MYYRQLECMARLSRRNAVIGLVVLAGGGGALAASGAFTAVEAERNVSIETAGDEDALLQIELHDEQFGGLSDAGDEIVEIQFEDLNLDSETIFEAALSVTPQGSSEQAGWEIDILEDFDGESLVEADDEIIRFVFNESASDTDTRTNVGADQSAVFDIEVHLDGIESISDLPENVIENNTIVIEAR